MPHKDTWLCLLNVQEDTLQANFILSQKNVCSFQFVYQIKSFAQLLISVRKPMVAQLEKKPPAMQETLV